MGLTKSRGNMYTWLSHTWNPIKGACQFSCKYCYVLSLGRLKQYQVPCYLDEKELGTNLGKGRTIFVGSTNDMWGKWVPDGWIDAVLNRCGKFPNNEYVFQSKNPRRFLSFKFPSTARTLLGTTIETDWYMPGYVTKAPPIIKRVEAMIALRPLRRFVTIEPIMDFNLSNMLRIIKLVKPEFITIGADSKGHGLNEPSAKKVYDLIDGLTAMKVKIRQKSNLERLLKGTVRGKGHEK